MDIHSLDKLRHCPNCDRYLEPSDFVGVYCKRCDDLTKQEFDPTIGPKEADRTAKVEDPMGRAVFDEPIDMPMGRRQLSGVELQNAAKEILVRRELARRHLLPFVEEFRAGYKAGWVHRDICQRLENFVHQVARGESPRLMLFMPPRSGKSELGTRSMPPWALGQYPWMEIIATSYAASLANTFSRKAREIMRDPAYTHIYPEAILDKDNQAVEQWLTTDGGGYVAAGVGGSIVGKGAHILIIDDPTKGQVEAKSETIQEQIRDWYTGSAYTRLAPGGGVLIIMQRWTEDDLAGWLLAEDASKPDDLKENWEVVRYPAIAEEDEKFRRKGEALHAERYPLNALKRIRATLGERDFSALYQQQPLPASGDYFTEDMFHYYGIGECPPLSELNIYAAWDLAIGEKQRNDMSVGAYVGVCSQGLIWVLHMERCRINSLALAERIFELNSIYKPITTGFEKGHIEGTMGPFLEKMMLQRREFFPYDALPVGNQDKEARATTIRGLMQMKQVWWPKHDSNVAESVAVMLRFPNGKHDDDVDAIAHVGRMIESLVAKRKPEDKPKATWRDKFILKMARGSGAAGGGTAMSA